MSEKETDLWPTVEKSSCSFSTIHSYPTLCSVVGVERRYYCAPVRRMKRPTRMVHLVAKRLWFDQAIGNLVDCCLEPYRSGFHLDRKTTHQTIEYHHLQIFFIHFINRSAAFLTGIL